MVSKNTPTESDFDTFDETEKSSSSNKTLKIEDSELYDQALGLVIRNHKISINQLRKLFKVGFKRAKRVVEQLEKNNIIEKYSGGGSSRILKVSKENVKQLTKENNSSFQYVNHILKIPNEINVVEEDEL